jgi:2-hydroxy-4-carboxymuconate semialdehyde hemiacetal dehydrogenase
VAVRVALAGAGAFGAKHLAALAVIDEVEVVAVASPNPAKVEALADEYSVSGRYTDLGEMLGSEGIDAVILATPTHLHAEQAIQVLEAGKHVEVEIPLCDRLEDGRRVVETQEKTGLVAMCGHTRRFNPSHQWVHQRIGKGELSIQHLVVDTFFFRRTNTNARGEPRSWTDHLLWHHAAHTVDLFLYQTGSSVVRANAVQGPIHPELGIAMDMSIQLEAESGALCSLALSFNNDGPLGTFFRYIGDSGTYMARYDDLVDGYEKPIDVSGVAVSSNGIELQDREFVAAIQEGREPNASVSDVLPTYEILDELERQLGAGSRS